MKKICLCKILKKIVDNAYVLEFPDELEISSTFNVTNLYLYEEGLTSGSESTIDWREQLPRRLAEEITEVLDEREVGQTRSQKKKVYLVRWRE